MDAEKILQALHDHYEESIFVTDGEGRLIFVNRVAAERLKVDLDYLEGKTVQELMNEGVYSQSTTMDAIRTKHPVTGPLDTDPNKVTFSNSVPVLDEDGEVVMVVTNNMSMEHNAEWEKIIHANEVEASRLQREREYLRLQDQRVLVANSPKMRNLLTTIEAVAPTDSNIVILGESGTGKDMFASLIHEKSARAGNAYISVNCAAMTESLLESELFGYEAGAFTGALRGGKMGLFEATSGGTLFLDEIGEMSLGLQSKLLRVLENHEVRRVGGVRNIPVDVRVICATNKHLPELVKEKKFREDLYYRLAVFTLDLPRLRDRTEDIIPIANMFLEELNRRNGTHKILSRATVRTMLNYDWPGNIRELRNVIERIYVVSPGNELFFLPMPVAKYGGELNEYMEQQEQEQQAAEKLDTSLGLKEYVRKAEKAYIEAVIEECGGSVAAAAQRLGVHRSALYRKLASEEDVAK